MALTYWPLEPTSHSVGSQFGERPGGFHAGQDFPAADGTKFYAIQAGTVQHIGPATGYGQWIVIDSDDSQGSGCIEYGHMWNAFATGLKVGSKVAAGQHIGYVGSNGQSSGPHLHVGVWPRAYGVGARVDPLKKLNGARWIGDIPASPNVGNSASAGGVGLKPNFRELDFMTGGGRSGRSRKPINWLLHTEQGNSSAENLARYCDGSNDVSYHYTIRDRIVCDVVDTDYASWSVLDANAFTINLCFAGSRAEFTRAQWLERRDDIEIAAYLAVQDCKKYGIPPVVIAPPYGAPRPGISDHRYATKALGIGSHTDVGPNFPWDVFAGFVERFAHPETAAPTGGLSVSASDVVERELAGRFQSRYVDPKTGRRSPFQDTLVGYVLEMDRKLERQAVILEAIAAKAGL